VKTHTGWVYVAFIIDAYSGMVIGWQASKSLRSDLAIDALEMAVFNRRRAGAVAAFGTQIEKCCVDPFGLRSLRMRGAPETRGSSPLRDLRQLIRRW
jgi:transposase InsO family protein